jgi:NAD(P)-dependent dehydrogenase (short-subunit alcohol dehydrogenase family)
MVMQQTKSPARPSLTRSLEGQRIVIIGGTSGFGMATAKAASAEGASVIVASSKKTNLDRALAKLPAGAEGHPHFRQQTRQLGQQIAVLLNLAVYFRSKVRQRDNKSHRSECLLL